MAEPPILKDVSDEGLKSFKDVPLKIDIPSNTQFLERLVQTVSKLGAVAASPKIRDGFAKATLASQKQLSCCETKSDFTNLKYSKPSV